MTSAYAPLLRKRSAEFVEQLATIGITATVDQQSLREYHIKLDLGSAGRLILYYKPSKKQYTLTYSELNSLAVRARIEQIWDGRDARPAGTKTPGTSALSAPAVGLRAYVDGSHINGRVGYGAVLLDGENVLMRFSGRVHEDTSTRQVAGELVATMKVIEYCAEHSLSPIDIYYDYAGIEKWARRQWKANLPLTQRYQDFIQETSVKVHWHKVRSHSGDRWNDVADQLARDGASA